MNKYLKGYIDKKNKENITKGMIFETLLAEGDIDADLVVQGIKRLSFYEQREVLNFVKKGVQLKKKAKTLDKTTKEQIGEILEHVEVVKCNDDIKEAIVRQLEDNINSDKPWYNEEEEKDVTPTEQHEVTVVKYIDKEPNNG